MRKTPVSDAKGRKSAASAMRSKTAIRLESALDRNDSPLHQMLQKLRLTLGGAVIGTAVSGVAARGIWGIGEHLVADLTGAFGGAVLAGLFLFDARHLLHNRSRR